MSETEEEARKRILIVDDEPEIRKFLRISLNASGYEVIEARSGEQALSKAAIETPALIILDLGLPDLDGTQVVERLREWSRIPVLILSVRSAETEKVRALDAGANDFVVKPFGIQELLARVRALLRDIPTSASNTASLFRSDDLEIDYLKRSVELDGIPVRLSKKEFELLKLLTQNAGRVLTHVYILGEVWGPAHTEASQYLRVYIGQIRNKLNDQPDAPRFIETVPRVGYRFIANETIEQD